VDADVRLIFLAVAAVPLIALKVKNLANILLADAEVGWTFLPLDSLALKLFLCC
jgi:hypothetical protein